MRLDTRPPMPAAEPVVKDDKPVSATICHILAVVGILGAVMWAGLTLWGWSDASGWYVVASSAVGGLIWWVIGDVVAGVHRKR